MGFVKVGMLTEVPPGSMKEWRRGETQVAICNVDGAVHALDNFCPHRGGPLAQGALHGRMVVCPWHAWEFDCVTGQHDFNPELRVKTYPVKVDGDEIFVDV